MTERTNEPSQDALGTAREQKSPCTDGEVGRWVDLCRSEAASLEAAHEAGKKPLAPLQAPHLLRGVADLLTRLSDERARVAEVLGDIIRYGESGTGYVSAAWIEAHEDAKALHATLSGERT